MLSDSEKFRLIMEKYPFQYDKEETLVSKLGIDRDIFNSWKEESMKIPKHIKIKISKAFHLKYSIWNDKIVDKSNFLNFIDNYVEIEDIDIEDEFSNDYYVKTGKKITDTQKFRVIFEKYHYMYKNQKILADDMNLSEKNISNWKKKDANISDNFRIAIGKKFRLSSMIWKDSFKSEEKFDEKLDNYSIDKFIDEDENKCADLNEEEQSILDALELEDVIDIQNYTDNRSNHFLYSFATLLENRGKIQDAIEVLSTVKVSKNTLDNNCLNKIEHLKAKLYSHKGIENWDQAIGILVKLKRKNYNRLVPEINTLYASNMKRKVLSDTSKNNTWIPKDKVDMSLLSNATLAYYEEYMHKKGTPTQYYDAINYAYLHRITEHLEEEEIEDIDLRSIYDEIWSTGSVDCTNWWQVISDVEFLILLGDINLAESRLNDFFENHSASRSEIEVTLRQLELYIHFTDDINATHFYNSLQEYSCGYDS